jgi:hypothetical protein
MAFARAKDVPAPTGGASAFQRLRGGTPDPIIITQTPRRGELPSPRATWRHLARMTPIFTPRPPKDRDHPASLVDVTLDPAQEGAASLPAGRALLVLGEAGHGKTTVAIHRIAHLWRARRADDTGRAAILVPTEGLARSIQPLLRGLGVDVEVQTLDAWAAGQARRALRDVPRRESEQGGLLVSRLKRDPALRVALAELARRPPARIDDDVDAPLGRSRALVRRADLQHLFGDRVLMEGVARASGAITSRMVDAVLEHTRVQFSRTAEDEWSHVTDHERLLAVDHRALDEGTASHDAGTIDVEDYAVLFELDRMRAAERARRGDPRAAPKSPRLHDIVLIDEAQEFAPLELALIGRSLAPGGTLIVAGDADQQTDPTTRFGGWHAAMQELGCSEYETVRLDIGYRCPPGVVALARAVAGIEAPPGQPKGPEPRYLRFGGERELGATLGAALAALQRRDPRASVAVVCRAPRTARRITTALQAEVGARLVFDGRFMPRGPVQVTTVDEVKGLEFDFVVVPDATADDYPDDPASRRALYVAVTRTRHQLVLATSGPPTPLLPPPE